MVLGMSGWFAKGGTINTWFHRGKWFALASLAGDIAFVGGASYSMHNYPSARLFIGELYHPAETGYPEPSWRSIRRYISLSLLASCLLCNGRSVRCRRIRRVESVEGTVALHAGIERSRWGKHRSGLECRLLSAGWGAQVTAAAGRVLHGAGSVRGQGPGVLRPTLAFLDCVAKI